MSSDPPLRLPRLQAEFGFSQPEWDVRGHEGHVRCGSDRFILHLFSDYWQMRLQVMDKEKGIELGIELPDHLKERHIPVWEYLEKLDAVLAVKLQEYLDKEA